MTTPGRLHQHITTVDPVTEPFWLIVGESYGPGWEAEVTGGETVGHTVISGYANGWLVRPDGRGPVVADVTWPPQRLVWMAIGLSLLVLAACLVLIVTDPGRRSRPTRGGDPGLRLAWPPSRERVAPVPVRRTALVAAGAALTGALVATPLVGLVLAGAAVVALRRPWGPVLLRLAPAAVVASVGAYVFVEQVRNDLPADFGWPKLFAEVHWLTMGAVLLVGLDVVVSVLRREGEATP